jgi:hypothetical protein
MGLFAISFALSIKIAYAAKQQQDALMESIAAERNWKPE